MFLGYRFFVPGAFYQVMTPRPYTEHIGHMFEVGTIVKCMDVLPANTNRTVLGSLDFNTPRLTGLFMNMDGMAQELATGDVRRCR